MQFLLSLLCRDRDLLEDAAGGVLQLTEIGRKTRRRNEIKLQQKSFVGLDLERSRKVLDYVQRVWRRPIVLTTVNQAGSTLELTAP